MGEAPPDEDYDQRHARLMMEVAYAVAFEGRTIEEAAVQYCMSPSVVRDAVAEFDEYTKRNRAEMKERYLRRGVIPSSKDDDGNQPDTEAVVERVLDKYPICHVNPIDPDGSLTRHEHMLKKIDEDASRSKRRKRRR